MQREAKQLTRWQWLLIGISATLLVVLIAVHSIYRGLHKNDYEQMLQRGRLVAACDNSPWGFDRTVSDRRGLGYELIHSIADSLGMELEINIHRTPNELLAELDKGYVDVVILPIAATERLKMNYLTSTPILRSPLVVVYNKSHGEAVDLTNLHEHHPTIQANSAVELRLKHLGGELGHKIKHQTLDDITLNELMELVVKSAINCTICPQALAEQYCKKYEDLGYSAPISVEQEYVWVVKKNRKETIKRLNVELERD